MWLLCFPMELWLSAGKFAAAKILLKRRSEASIVRNPGAQA